jgi:beta-glucosidase
MSNNKSFFIVLVLQLTFMWTWGQSNGALWNNQGWKDSVEMWLSQMTIEEKVGQMTQINLDVVCEGEIYKLIEPHHIDPNKLRKAIVDWHVGSVLNCGGHAYTRDHWHQLIGAIQQEVQSQSRLKIPVLYGIDAIHGANYVLGSTLFPQQLGQAATFNPSLVRNAASITAYETRAAGMPWNFSPVLDVGRNPLWSRFFETYGEDPYVCSTMGRAAVEGYQGVFGKGNIDDEHVAACMKHFLGYSGARSGKDRTPAILSEIELREIYRPSFQAAIDAGAASVMINSGEINGIPVHANPKILVELLRDEMGFKGMAVTDWEDIIKLEKNHRVANDLKEAVYLAVMAGIDMCMVPNDFDFTRLLIELVKEGKISSERINESVRRILYMKYQLGIMTHPLGKLDYPNFGCDVFQKTALKTALSSITLLKNEKNVFPLKAGSRLYVAGPAASSMSMLNGAWTRTWQGTDPQWDDNSKNTLLEALTTWNGSQTRTDKSWEGGHWNPKSINKKEIKKAEVIVLCLGETPSTEKPGDIDDLTLDHEQLEFVRCVQELRKEGKPMVLVLAENRPRLIAEIEPFFDAIWMMYQPGDYGADALVKLMNGEVYPSGRLPFTYPKHPHTLLTYDHKYTETLDPQFGNNAYQPQWPFGHGLSYATFQYSNLNLEKKINGNGNWEIEVSMKIKNDSAHEAEETTLLYVQDRVASVTPHVKRLKRFQKLTYSPKEEKEIKFYLNQKDFEFIGKDAMPVFEPGEFRIMVGGQELNILLP